MPQCAVAVVIRSSYVPLAFGRRLWTATADAAFLAVVMARYALLARRQAAPRSHDTGRLCWWRRRTGIEPASDAARRSLVLKTRGTTRNPDASGHDSTGIHPA